MNIEADNRTCEQIASSEEYRTRVAEEHRLMDERLGQTAGIGNPESLPIGPKVPRVTRRFDPATGQTFICSDAGLDPRINDGNKVPKDEILERLQRRLLE